MSDEIVPVITIDGPSGTGKGTICHMLAKHLQWHMLDSGAIYRVLAYAVHKKGIQLTDIEKIINLAKSLDLRFESAENNASKIFLDNQEYNSGHP